MVQLSSNNLYAFILGRETKIALLELESVLRSFGVCFDVLSVSHNVAVIKIENMSDVKCQMLNVMNCLGGTIKIFQIVGETEKNLLDQIVRVIRDDKGQQGGKINFGISDYSSRPMASNDINKMGLAVKNALKKSQNTRFVALKEEAELAPIVSFKNKLDTKGVEIGLFQNPKSQILNPKQIQNLKSEFQKAESPKLEARSLIGHLVAVTNPEEWSKRDYGKPRGDKYSGMMPPKLARMLVNITLSQANLKSNLNSKLRIENFNDFVVVDPFCGSGNILMEAAMLGCEVIGSDVSEKAVEDTKTNLEWLEQNFQFSIFNFQSNLNDKIFQADATTFDFSEKLKARSLKLAAIVTEPYLGSPKKYAPSMNAARGEYQKVKNLYINFLKNLKVSMQESGSRHEVVGTICIIFPLVETQEGKQFSLFSECIDEIKKMGYTLIREPLVYGREYQIVKREIVLLKVNR